MMNRQEYHLKEGTILDDRYVIGDVLGEGGFGITYSAINSNNGRRVAVKEYFCREYMTRHTSLGDQVTLTGESGRERFASDKERFLKEARTLRDFSGLPGIVKVLDQFEENGTACLVMEYLDGVTLKKYEAEKGRMPAEAAFRMMIPVIRTLSDIHKAGVIHRDISPDNMMVSPDGTLTLMDFGAAKDFVHSETTHSMIYKDGYAAKEQFDRKGRLGPWTDIYSLCAVLYFTVTGNAPNDSLQRILHDELKRPSKLGVSIDAGAEDILMKGLRLRENERWQSMDELLAAILQLYPEKDPEEERKRKKRKTIISIAAAAAVFAALFFSLRYYYAHETEFRFRNMETETSILYKPDDMSEEDFRTCTEIIRGRIEAFSGKDNYLWSSGPEEIRYTVPLECFGGQDPERVTKEYISRSLTITFSGNFSGYDSFGLTPVDRSDLLSVKRTEGRIDGISVREYGLPDDSPYIYLELVLSDALCETLGFMSKKNYPCYLNMDAAEFPERFYRWQCFSKGDGCTLLLIDSELQDRIGYLMEYDLLHDPLPESLSINTEWPVRWENPETSLFSGQYQCSPADFKEKTALLRYDTGSDKRGETYALTYIMKERLDTLKTPYAFGVSKLDPRNIVIRISPSAILESQARMLAKSAAIEISGIWDEACNIYSPLISASEETDWKELSVFESVLSGGKNRIRVNIDPWTRESYIDNLKEMDERGETGLFIYIDGYYERRAGKTTIQEALRTASDGYVLFDLPEAAEPYADAMADFLNVFCREKPSLSTSLSHWQYLDENGRMIRRGGLAVTGYEDQDEKLNDLQSRFSDDGCSFSFNFETGVLTVTISGLDGDHFMISGLEVLKHLLVDAELDDGTFHEISAVLQRKDLKGSKTIAIRKDELDQLMTVNIYNYGLSDEEWKETADYLKKDDYYKERIDSTLG